MEMHVKSEPTKSCEGVLSLEMLLVSHFETIVYF